MIDNFGYTAETLTRAMREPLNKVRSGQFPVQRISIRLLVLDTRQPLALPARGGEDPR